MNLTQAKHITGGLSNPSKMPGYGYNLPASYCRIGSKMSKVEGSVCSECYAKKGRYRFRNVQDAMERRRQSLIHPRWNEAMKLLISHYCKDEPYFRFHDSGDIQNLLHLDKIVKLCKSLPNIKFWLPTLENKLIVDYFFGDIPTKVPGNLNIRMSSPMIDKMHVTELITQSSITSSSVNSEIGAFPKAILCPATTVR